MTTDAARARWRRPRAKAGHGEGWAGGTVGAVARDARGAVAAATSTGRPVNKRVGRVGRLAASSAPGTYADDDGGACSATGDGEAVMRALPRARARCDLCARGVAPRGRGARGHPHAGGAPRGTGGVILVDRAGRLGLARNTRDDDVGGRGRASSPTSLADGALSGARVSDASQLSAGLRRAGLAVDRVLQPVAQPLRALDALGLEGVASHS